MTHHQSAHGEEHTKEGLQGSHAVFSTTLTLNTHTQRERDRFNAEEFISEKPFSQF